MPNNVDIVVSFDACTIGSNDAALTVRYSAAAAVAELFLQHIKLTSAQLELKFVKNFFDKKKKKKTFK